MGYRRSRESKRRLKKLSEATEGYSPGGAWYNPDKKRYVRYHGSNTPGYTKFLRRMSNRKVRKYGELLNNSLYKKAYDYWWILY